MTQLDLALPRSRRRDPSSSRIAASTVAGEQQQSECRAILALLRAEGRALSYREIWVRLKPRIAEAVEVMRRLDNLRTDGYVQNEPQKRICTVSRRPVQTWEAVPS